MPIPEAPDEPDDGFAVESPATTDLGALDIRVEHVRVDPIWVDQDPLRGQPGLAELALEGIAHNDDEIRYI